MASSIPYMPPIGAICTARRATGDFRVINHIFDGLVKKYGLQSLQTGDTIHRFNHEITVKSSSNYTDIYNFLGEVAGLTEQDLNLIIEPFELESESIDLGLLAEFAEINDNCKRDDSSATDPPRSKRFKTATAYDVDQLKSKNTELTTDRQTKWAVKLFKEWMIEAGYRHSDFEWLPTQELDKLLECFYAAVQTKDGKNYSKAALVGIRAGINRHLTTPPNSRLINIMNDRDFQSSNQVLTGLVKVLKREGKDISCHKEPIELSDINKLYESGVFSLNRPTTLLNKVLFDVICQFGRRGNEGLRQLNKKSFVTLKDAKGRKYVKIAFNEADKTHHGLDSRETQKEPRMYETVDSNCPVKSFEKYVSKLNPKCPDFFQKPLDKFSDDQAVWYAARPIGKNTLATFMSRMSLEAGLSRRYTNHCIRAYTSTTLFKKGFSNRAIMSVTGHRNETSLTSYIKPSEDEREALSNALCPSVPKNQAEKYSAATENSSTATILDTTSPPTNDIMTDRVSNSNKVDVNVDHKAIMNMFTGAISNSTIHVNMYSK